MLLMIDNVTDRYCILRTKLFSLDVIGNKLTTLTFI